MTNDDGRSEAPETGPVPDGKDAPKSLTGPIEVREDGVEGQRSDVPGGEDSEPHFDSPPRDSNGRWQRGHSANPRGRKKKTPFGRTLSAVLAGRLSDYDEGNLEKTFKERIVDAAIAEALAGNMRAIEFIFERMEGKVPVKVDLTERIREIALSEGLDPDKAVTEAKRLVGSDER